MELLFKQSKAKQNKRILICLQRPPEDSSLNHKLKFYILKKKWTNGFITFSSTVLREGEMTLLEFSLQVAPLSLSLPGIY